MEKIKSLPQAVIVAQAAKKSGKKIGFITGCFDILHEGHIDLFRFAKKHVDFLVIALDSDEAIREGKPACRQGRGEGRPIHSQKQRARILSELESVDMVIPITGNYSFLKKNSVESLHDKIRDAVEADFIITTPQADKYWESKKERAEKAGVKILLFTTVKPSSTSKIINKISEEY